MRFSKCVFFFFHDEESYITNHLINDPSGNSSSSGPELFNISSAITPFYTGTCSGPDGV